MFDFSTQQEGKKETVVEVIVGNIGLVYHGNNLHVGKKTFLEYRRLSKSGTGKVRGEEVSILLNGDDISSTIGKEV